MQSLRRYKCHKEVQAVKIKEVVCHAESFSHTNAFEGGHIFPEGEGHPIPFDAEYFRKHNPQAGGYYVVYDDGYTSYSPAEPFESGYTLLEDSDQSDETNDRMMKWFAYAHLPDHLQEVSRPFHQIAQQVCQRIDGGPERTVALRKLLEAKDAAVRATVHPGS